MATTPATSTDLPGKEDTNHVDVEQQNAERRQDETVEPSPEVPTTRPRGRPPVRMSVEAKKAKLMEVEVPLESQAADEDMAPGHRGEDESPNKKQRVEHTVSHVTGDSEVEDLATNEEMETYIECDGTYWDEDGGEQLEPSQVQAGIEREVKQMRDLDVAEVRRCDEVPEGVRVWSGRWCHRKKAGGVRSRYVVRQYRTEWSEDAFCGTPGWVAIRPLLAVASLMRWMVMPGDFSTAFMHTPLLDSDEYWIEPPREVVTDKRYVWKLKKALNGLVAASKRFQQYLFRLLRDLGFESCPLLPTLLRNPITGTIMVVHVNDRRPAVRASLRWECTLPRGRGSRCTTRRRRSTWARDSGAPNPGSWRCRRKAASRASGPLRNRRCYMSEAGEVRRRRASRTSRRQRTMRRKSGESCTLHLQADRWQGAVHHPEEARRDVRPQGGGATLAGAAVVRLVQVRPPRPIPL